MLQSELERNGDLHILLGAKKDTDLEGIQPWGLERGQINRVSMIAFLHSVNHTNNPLKNEATQR